MAFAVTILRSTGTLQLLVTAYKSYSYFNVISLIPEMTGLHTDPIIFQHIDY